MLSELMKNWGESIIIQKDIINKEINEYFKYIKDQYISYKDLIGKYDLNKTNFLKAEEKLLIKKEELYKNKNIEKWNINSFDLKKADKIELINNKEYAFKFMMTKESFKVENLKEIYIYYLNQLFEHRSHDIPDNRFQLHEWIQKKT